jgi:DNA (cytosine-5)-methyltransferase 1
VQSSPVVAAKIARIVGDPNSQPRVLDLFAGCGGLSLGFQSAGCEVVAAVESDPLAAQSHATNLFKDRSADFVAHHAQPRDITKLEPEVLADEFALGDSAAAFDIIVGGPPCQAYARVGRAKLREVAEHPEAFKIDPRANLYLRYLHYVERLQPLALLMENVPDILNFGGHNIVQEIVDALDARGYDSAYSLINAAHHGVPQMRDRVYLLAFRKELDAIVRFPAATHSCTLPHGYDRNRAMALKRVEDGTGFIPHDVGHEDLPDAVTAEEAISDLPPITEHLQGALKRGPRRFTQLAPYRRIAPERLSSYARKMRFWPGFEGGKGVFDHVLRYLPRDAPIFRIMQSGDEYPAARRAAERQFQAKARRRQLKAGSQKWLALQKATVPPYDPSKFPNKWWKMNANAPVRTLTAHIGRDTYSHIHYDSTQARVITVREAARLQSFPDGFKFAGTMNPAFRQIGNAVPPLLARQFGELMISALRAVRPAMAA